MNAFQSLGSVEELIVTSQTAFHYPEFATVQTLLSDGVAVRNFVLQSGAPSIRESAVTWDAQADTDVDAIRGYAESKELVLYTEEDGTYRDVIVMDFGATLIGADLWSVSCRLLEATDPTAGS